VKRSRLLRWLKAPHGVWLVIIYIATVGFGICAVAVSVLGTPTFPQAVIVYAVYAVAALLLGYSVYTIVKVIPDAKRHMIGWLKKHRFTRMLLEEFDFQTLMFSIGSFVINVGYAVYNGIIGITANSIWYLTFAVYYLILAILRGNILLYHYYKKKRNAIGSEQEKMLELKSYRSCGFVLIALPICLSVAIRKMVTGENSFHYYGFTIYVAAVYAFYKIIMSVRNVFRARRSDDLSIRAARSINFADALVSILALQTALLESFAAEKTNIGLYNALTGGGVCLLTAALGFCITVNASACLRKIRKQREKQSPKNRQQQ